MLFSFGRLFGAYDPETKVALVWKSKEYKMPTQHIGKWSAGMLVKWTSEEEVNARALSLMRCASLPVEFLPNLVDALP